EHCGQFLGKVEAAEVGKLFQKVVRWLASSYQAAPFQRQTPTDPRWQAVLNNKRLTDIAAAIKDDVRGPEKIRLEDCKRFAVVGERQLARELDGAGFRGPHRWKEFVKLVFENDLQ